MPPVTLTTTNATSVSSGADSHPTLRKGARGTAVRELQTALKAKGYDLAVDGDFGPGTDKAVKKFQQAQGLPADGVVGPKTWAKLDAGNATPTAPTKPTTTPPAQTGNKLDCFPIVGQDGTTKNARYNIGYDPGWKNFDPATGTQNSDFSFNKTNASHPTGHLGVDIFAPKGQPVVAPVSGEVVNAGWDSSGGNRVTIKRGSEYFYLAHLNKIDPSVHVGMRIDAGSRVGEVGDTGKAKGTAPHLHFSIYKGGNYRNSVNPFPSLLEAHKGARANPNDFF